MKLARVAGACVALALVVPTPAGTAAEAAPSSRAQPNAVIALIDTGINPYHQVFRDRSPRAYRHPSTYIPGFPKRAKALRLSLDATDYPSALRTDCEVWEKVERGKLYWFPGTRIVGAISFDRYVLGDKPPVDCDDARTFEHVNVLDLHGHGTMVASRAAARDYGACEECLIVSVQGFSSDVLDWTGANSRWIDLQSNSWLPFVPLWEPTSTNKYPLVATPELVRSIERAARRHLAFWASGNGVGNRGGLVGHPTILDPAHTPSVIMVGGHDSGYMNVWPSFPPHVVSDSCESWAAYHNKMDESAEDVGGGTSGASPFAAGGAGEILLEARRILGDSSTGVSKKVVARGARNLVPRGPLRDGRFTLSEWKTVVLRTANPRPERQPEDGSVCHPPKGLVLYSTTPVAWKDVPEGYPEFLHIGYGSVDRFSVKRAFNVLRGTQDVPDRQMTDRYFELDSAARSLLHEIFRG